MSRIQLPAEFVRDWNRIRRKVDGLSGAGVTNRPDTITIGGNPVARRSMPSTGEDLPTPQYQGMVYCGVAANQGGWAYLPAVTTV